MAGESAHFRLRERPPTPATRAFELPPRMQPMLDRAKNGLAEPFHGIIIDGGIVPGLFAVEKSEVSLVPLVEAARSFLASLNVEQRKAACFAIDDEAWRRWSNIHPWLMRHGICLADLDGNQREVALALMREAMSAPGYQAARDVMRLNEHALEITGNPRNTANGSIGSASSVRRHRISRGAGRSTAITSTSTASCSAISSY